MDEIGKTQGAFPASTSSQGSQGSQGSQSSQGSQWSQGSQSDQQREEKYLRAVIQSSSYFKITMGVFTKFAQKAALALKSAEENKPPIYVMIIDEINRGQITQIFGEIMTIMEDCGKNRTVHLGYPLEEPFDKGFYVPENLFIIGTMNTADVDTRPN